jgi:hypothetical protein
MCSSHFEHFLLVSPRFPSTGPKRRPGGADICATLLPARAIAVAGLASGLLIISVCSGSPYMLWSSCCFFFWEGGESPVCMYVLSHTNAHVCAFP